MSLSPRPERFTRTISDGRIVFARRNANATAWDDSSAGWIPSYPESREKPESACASVTETYSALPVSFSQACSGPTPG